MRNTKILLTFLLVTGISFCLLAQPRREKKWREAVLALEKSEFVLKYDEVKTSIEEQLAEFHRQRKALNPTDVAAVKRGYEATLVRFDQILENLKKDFTNPQQRAWIASHPDDYSKNLSWQLNEAVVFYENQCKLIMDEIPEFKKKVAFAFPLMEVGILIQLTKELVQLMSNDAAKMEKMSGEYFENNFTSNHRLKRWEHY